MAVSLEGVMLDTELILGEPGTSLELSASYPEFGNNEEDHMEVD